MTIPPRRVRSGNPTGIVFNGNANAFRGALRPVPAAAKFIFATEDGVIAVWNPGGASPSLRSGQFDRHGAVYKGLALSAAGNGARLYATDFHNNKIDVWDGTFTPVTLPPARFTDPKIPSGFAPFGIQAINGNIYVTYAKQDADAHDDVQGKGLGYVDVYDPNGNLLDRVASKGKLNAPWGLALAPAGFGDFSNSLLVGNFGDGHINAFDLATGDFLGQMKDANGKTLAIDGLWGLAFGNGYPASPSIRCSLPPDPMARPTALYGRLDPAPGKGNGHN